jgi:hypothetical protein
MYVYAPRSESAESKMLEASSGTLRSLRGTVLRYTDPLEPVGLEDWE